jgi:branched-chain amino acid transport system permease protein
MGALQCLAAGPSGFGPFLEVLAGGLLAGVLYSLVALGFVLIFKASGVFNFAQGAMTLFAALCLARLSANDLSPWHFVAAGAIVGGALGWAAFEGWRRRAKAASARRLWAFALAGAALGAAAAAVGGAGGWPLWLAFLASAAIMVAVAFAIERLVLRPLVNQEGIILFMATLGVTFFLDGFGQTVWGSDIYKIELGIPADPLFVLDPPFEGGVLIDRLDFVAAVVAGALVVVLALFFQKTRTGRALRAVADDHQAAQSIGIPLNTIWVIVWAVAGFVALVAGMMWGAKLGVQFSLQQIALKALPVLILGGFTSVPGAIVGGLIIGAGEKLAEVYLGGPCFGGGIENWFAYVLALAFLLFRPQGLFGERIIERV